MITKLLTYGDSFTAGDGIDPQYAWPAYLGKMLGLEVDNRGLPGGSNKLSIIKMMNDLGSLTGHGNLLVGFSWTSASRTCFYNTCWKNVLPHWDDKDDRVNVFSQAYYGAVFTEVDALFELISQQIFVSSFLRERKIKFFFINSMRDINIDYVVYLKTKEKQNLEQIKEHESFLNEYKNLINLVDKTKYVLGYDHSIKEDYCDTLNMYCDDGHHPSYDAHNMVAARIFWFLHDNKILIQQQ
jgi:hypothetical protein